LVAKCILVSSFCQHGAPRRSGTARTVLLSGADKTGISMKGFTMVQIKSALKTRGLRVSGNKAEIFERLLLNLREEAASSVPQAPESSSVQPLTTTNVNKRKKPMFRSINPTERAVTPAMKVVYTDDLYDSEEQVSYDSYDETNEDFGVAGSTLRQVAHDYNFPLDFLVSSAVEIGLTPPVDCDRKLSELLNGEQCFAIVEALTTIDPAEAHDRFMDFPLAEVADDFGVELSRVFMLCGQLEVNLPQGVRTHLRTSEYDKLVSELEAETGISSRRILRVPKRLDVASPKDADPLAMAGDAGLANGLNPGDSFAPDNVQFGADGPSLSDWTL